MAGTACLPPWATLRLRSPESYGDLCELSQDQSAGTKAAAGDFGFRVLASSDAAEKTKQFDSGTWQRKIGHHGNERLAIMAGIWPDRGWAALASGLSSTLLLLSRCDLSSPSSKVLASKVLSG